MTAKCATCGEELLGAVNRCWRCGTRIETPPGDGGEPPVRRTPVMHVLAAGEATPAVIDAPADATAESDAPVMARRVGSPFAESFTPTGAPAARVAAGTTVPRSTSTNGGVAALVLGVLSFALSFFTPFAIIVAVVSVALGIWGLYAERRGPAMIGILLGCLALAIGGFNEAVRIYENHYGHSPWEAPLDDGTFDDAVEPAETEEF